MPTPEYYQKQTELLLVWALATTDLKLKASLIARALEYWALADRTNDGILHTFEVALQSLGRPDGGVGMDAGIPGFIPTAR